MKNNKVIIEIKFAKARFRIPVAIEIQIKVVVIENKTMTAIKNPYATHSFLSPVNIYTSEPSNNVGKILKGRRSNKILTI